MPYRIAAESPPREPPFTLRIFSRPFLAVVAGIVGMMLALVPAIGEIRGMTLACPGAGTANACEVRELRFGVQTRLTPLDATRGGLTLERRDDNSHAPHWFLVPAGAEWSRQVDMARGRIAVHAYDAFVASGGTASFALRFPGTPWWTIVLLAGLVVTFALGGRYAPMGLRLVLDVESDLLTVERRYMLRRVTKTKRELSSIASASIRTQDDSNESDVMVSGSQGNPKPLLRAMHYDCDRLVEAIEASAARARAIHGDERGT